MENGTTLRLSLVDTPGFGDAVDNNKWYGRGGDTVSSGDRGLTGFVIIAD